MVHNTTNAPGTWQPQPAGPPTSGTPRPCTCELCEDVDPMPDCENVLTD
jgi:hypothetical protein